MILDLQKALSGVIAIAIEQSDAMRTATIQQLQAVYEGHPRVEEILSAVFPVQRSYGLYIDPKDNWFLQNLQKFGRGFNMKDLPKLASKFDRLAEHYDHWTVGNQSKVESFIVRCARRNKLVIPPPPPTAKDEEQTSAKTHATAEPRRRTRILDVACGIGVQEQVLRLCGYNGELVGSHHIDISPGMIHRVKERGCYDHAYVANANGCCPSSTAVTTMTTTVSSNDELLYDVVICTGVMELLDQPLVLSEMAEVTVSNGEIWVSFQHYPYSAPSAEFDALDADDKIPTEHHNVHGMSIDKAMELLHQVGFGNVVYIEVCPDAFFTPSPNQDGTLLPVPYI